LTKYGLGYILGDFFTTSGPLVAPVTPILKSNTLKSEQHVAVFYVELQEKPIRDG
jgi:hypothetical protein